MASAMDLARCYRATTVGEQTTFDLRAVTRAVAVDLVVGAGFSADVVGAGRAPDRFTVTATRQRSLPDTVGPGMRVLYVGLNPSTYAADAGVGYARPGNRFWPALLAAGLVTRDRDAFDAYHAHGVGLTDLVKRATPRSADLERGEYERGAARVERVVHRERPAVVAFVGLEGYRVAIDRAAKVGWQESGFGGVPTYVMPSTSGLNAHAHLDDFVMHIRELTLA